MKTLHTHTWGRILTYHILLHLICALRSSPCIYHVHALLRSALTRRPPKENTQAHTLMWGDSGNIVHIRCIWLEILFLLVCFWCGCSAEDHLLTVNYQDNDLCYSYTGAIGFLLGRWQDKKHVLECLCWTFAFSSAPLTRSKRCCLTVIIRSIVIKHPLVSYPFCLRVTN